MVLKDIAIGFFGYVEENGSLKILYLVTLGKNQLGRGPSCPPIFGHSRRALKLLTSDRMSLLATF